MAMVCGLDLHRRQITFDALETETGESWRGRVWQPDRARFRRWLREDLAARARSGEVALVVEGCTRWRFVVGEITAAGFEAHVAETADTQAMRGRKRHAKTDRTDAALLRELLACGDLPESWIPPEAVLEWRERVRLYKALVDQRTMWCQRIHAELYQHGVSVPEGSVRSAAHPGVARGRRGAAERRGPRPDPGRVSDDRGDRDRGPTLEARPATVRVSSAGVSSARGCPVRDRRVDRGGGVVRAGRLPSLRPLRAGGAPLRARCHRRRVGPPSRGGSAVATGTRDVALGALRSRDELVASTQPRPRPLHPGQSPPRRQDRRHLRRPPTGPTLLPRAAQPRPGPGLRAAVLSTLHCSADRGDGHRPSPHQGPARSAPASGVPASTRAGRPQNNDPTALPAGGHPNTNVVADEPSLVEHPGNAGRPHVAADRPIPHRHHPPTAVTPTRPPGDDNGPTEDRSQRQQGC